MGSPITLKIQKWGNSLAVRIPASVARSAGFREGQPVQVSLAEAGVLVIAAGESKLTLKQRLALFDPKAHGGEAMVSAPLGEEVF